MPTRSSALALTLLLFGAALAGCLNRGEDAPREDAKKQSAAGDALGLDANATANITDDGTKAGNETLGHMPHLHDYWQGKERVTLMDDDVEVTPEQALFFTFFDVFVRQNPAVGGAFVRLPEGATVFEGTGELEITATWEDATVSGLAVRYRTAADPAFTEATPLSSGQPLVVQVTPEMTDMPHVSTSRWAFFFEPAGPANVVYGKFHLKVDIVKMRDIGLFPGHPELFNGATEKILLDTDGTAKQTNFVVGIANVFTTGNFEEDDGIPSQEVVPMETQEMRVEVTVKSATTTTGGDIADVYLMVKTADRNGYDFYENIDSESDPATGKYVYAVPVEMRNVDSPYAKESQWKFTIRVASNVLPGQDSACGGCTDSQTEFHITVTAFDHTVLTTGTEQDDDGGRVAAPARALAPSAVGNGAPAAPALAAGRLG